MHILSSLERRSQGWTGDRDAGRAALSAAISLVLRLLGKDPDPAKSREHVLLAVLAERRLEQGQTAELGSLLDDVLNPPIERIGAFGMGVVVATQNPMDLDYRALSNAGFWAVGRLQTDADRERVVDSLANANEAGSTAAEIDNVIRRLGPRWFLVRNVHATPNTLLVQPRWAMSFLRGPMTLGDVRRAAGSRG